MLQISIGEINVLLGIKAMRTVWQINRGGLPYTELLGQCSSPGKAYTIAGTKIYNNSYKLDHGVYKGSMTWLIVIILLWMGSIRFPEINYYLMSSHHIRNQRRNWGSRTSSEKSVLKSEICFEIKNQLEINQDISDVSPALDAVKNTGKPPK